MIGTLNSLATVVLDYPLSALKDSARPVYWVPDEECYDCCVCLKPFDLQQSSSSNSLSSSSTSTVPTKLRLHHCRQCGKGCCDDCSKSRKPVPLRGWDTPVRVCDLCENTELQLASAWDLKFTVRPIYRFRFCTRPLVLLYKCPLSIDDSEIIYRN